MVNWKNIYKTIGSNIPGLKKRALCFLCGSLLFLLISLLPPKQEDLILSYTVNPQIHNVQLYWKNEKGEILKNVSALKSFLESKHKHLLFAMNGGMYKTDNSPQGLYMENQRTLTPIDTSKGEGNFYLLPNGIFYLTTDKKAGICKTEEFKSIANPCYATQSGPMLLIEGKIHPAFKAGSGNLNIRNGVGILPDNTVLFAMSKKEINFYDFASYFKSKGCRNALYLDGFVSRAYLPEQNWMQTDGNFGVMIAVTEEKKK